MASPSAPAAPSGPDRYPAWSEAAALDLLEPLLPLRGALLPMLHALQEHFGYVDAEALPLLARLLNLSVAEVHGVRSFYHDFREAPPRGPVVRLCRAEACQAVGSDALAAHAEARLARSAAAGEAWELGQVFCLGNCALGPSATVDGRLQARLDAARLDGLLDQALAAGDAR